jgi:hypothetical protein
MSTGAGNMGDGHPLGQHEENMAAFGQSRSDGGRTLLPGEDVPLFGGDIKNHTGFASSCHVRNLRERDG